MVLVIECIIICILFSLGIFIPLYKNPVGEIMSYPKKIRERVEVCHNIKIALRKKRNFIY